MQVVGIRFKKACKIYHFSPGAIQDLKAGDYVIVETSRGHEAGQVAMAPHDVPDNQITGQLKPVIRRAKIEDMLSRECHAMREMAAVERCRRKVAEYNLPMKVVRAEYSFDGSSLVFFFTSEKRVDFRELVKDLAHLFHTRIELRQIGVRDEAKFVGGIGPCGRLLCCASHLAEFEPVSIKMAKQQDLPLSPMEISGLCGRLLCCLAYEDEYYREARQNLPKVGETVDTEYGQGRVLGANVIKEALSVELESGMTVEIPWGSQEEAEEEEGKPAEQQKARRRSRRRRTRPDLAMEEEEP